MAPSRAYSPETRRKQTMRSIKFLSLLFVFAAVSVYAQSPAAVNFNESGKSRHAKGDRAGAIADFTKAIETDPKYAMAYNNRGATRNDIGDFDGALADLTRASDRSRWQGFLNRAIARGERLCRRSIADYLKRLRSIRLSSSQHRGPIGSKSESSKRL